MKQYFKIFTVILMAIAIQGCATILGESVTEEHSLDHENPEQEFKFPVKPYKVSDNYKNDIDDDDVPFKGTTKEAFHDGIGEHMAEKSKLPVISRRYYGGDFYRVGSEHVFRETDEGTMLIFHHMVRSSNETERATMYIDTEYSKGDDYVKVKMTCPETFEEFGFMRGGISSTPTPTKIETSKEDFETLCSEKTTPSLKARIKVEGYIDSPYSEEAVMSNFERLAEKKEDRNWLEPFQDDFTYGLAGASANASARDLIEPESSHSQEAEYFYFLVESDGYDIPVGIKTSPYRDGAKVEYQAIYHYDIKGDGTSTYSENHEQEIKDEIKSIVND